MPDRRSTGVRFLVVEDETYIAELIQVALELWGNSCALAHDAEQADRLLSEQSVEALTVDLGMPGRCGLDWLESVARSQPELARRTLVITGMELRRESVERVARCGAGVLAKPFTLERLRDAVRTQIEHGGAMLPRHD